MKKLLFLLIAVLGVLMVASSVYASDQEDTTGAQVNGEPIHTMSITSGSSMSYQDPGDMGPQTYTLTGSPVTLVIADNDIGAMAMNDLLVKGKLTGTLPTQYGTSGAKTYRLQMGVVEWTPDADTDVTPLAVWPAVQNLSGIDFPVLGASDSTTGRVAAGTLEMDIFLVVNSDRRVYGSTSDSLTIEYTFVDF